MNRNKKFSVGAAILVTAIAYLVYAGVEQGSTYYFTIEEFVPKRTEFIDQPVRVAGRVAPGSLLKNTTSAGSALSFNLGDFVGEGAASSAGSIGVHYTGIVPDMFAEGRDVIVEGRYDGTSIQAKTIMTSCPSKYEPGKGPKEAADS